MFIRINLKEDTKVKFNLDRVSCVTLEKDEQGRKFCSVVLSDGDELRYTEGIAVDDAEAMFNKFPC